MIFVVLIVPSESESAGTNFTKCRQDINSWNTFENYTCKMAFTYILANESKPSLSAKVTWTPVCKLCGEMHNTRKDRIINLWLFNHMMTSNGNIFRVIGPLWGESIDHRGQWGGALMFSLICTWTDGWANTRDAGDLRRHRALYEVFVMTSI